MRMWKKQMLSIIVAFALIFGCFAGTAITAKAGIFEISVSSEELESKGGEVTVSVAGEELNDEIWWTLEKRTFTQDGEEIYETIGEKMNAAEVDDTRMYSEFPVNVPENEETEDASYRIRVSRTEPFHPESGEYVWEETDVTLTVLAGDKEDTTAGVQPQADAGEEENPGKESEEDAEPDEGNDGETLEMYGESENAQKEAVIPKEITPQAASVPKYHNIPAYQQKDIFSTETVRIKGVPTEEITGGVKKPLTKSIKFKIFNCTKQKVEQYVQSQNGMLPDLNLVKDHNYIIFAVDSEYQMKNTYIWVKGNQIVDIKKNADTYDYPELTSLQLSKRGSVTDDPEDTDRVLVNLPVYYKEGRMFGIKVRLVSDVETVEAISGGSDGKILVNLLEDVTYMVTVDNSKYDVEMFPIAVKDKSEYEGARYYYDHSNCKRVTELHLIDKKNAHKNDKTITSLSGNTTISGFNFKDFLAMEKKLSKSLVTELSGKDYDVFDISVVNPHRWEISKLAAGNFHITEKISSKKKVRQVYCINGAGKLVPLSFKQEKNMVSFSMNSLSIHPVVIEYKGSSSSAGNQSGTGVEVEKITVTGISKSIAAGKKIQLKAKITPSDASNQAVKWTSSNKKYATVDSKGKVATKKAGAGKSVKITASAKDGSGKKGTYTIKIKKNAVTKISLKAKKTVKAGKKVTIKAVVKANGKKANKKLSWTSSNKDYAVVNSKGKVTAKKAGKGKTVKITAKATDGSGKKKTIAIKIK